MRRELPAVGGAATDWRAMERGFGRLAAMRSSVRDPHVCVRHTGWLVAILLVGCTPATFPCQSDAQCSRGRCEPSGFCSFRDPSCQSGWRYGSLAPGELAHECVEPTTEPSPVPDGPDAEEEAGSTGGGGDEGPSAPKRMGSDESGSTTAEAGSCGDGQVDPGEACDGDEGCNRWCQRSGSVLWSDAYDSDADDRAYALDLAADGSFVVVGYTGPSPTDDLLIRRYDDAGTLLWSHRGDRPGSDRGWAVQHDPSGDLFVAGFVDNGSRKPLLARYDRDGVILWEYVDTVEGRFWDIDRGEDGTLYAAGERRTAAGDLDLLVQAFDPSGTLIWTYTRDGGMAADDEAQGLRYHDGALLLAGSAYVDDPNEAGLLAKLDAADGTEQWFNAVASEGTGFTQLVDVAERFGDVIAVGTEHTSDMDRQLWVGTCGADGSGIDFSSRGGPEHDELYGIVVDADGEIFVAGYASGTSTDAGDALVAKLDLEGEVQWSQTFAGDVSGADRAWALQLASEGTLLAAGYETSALGGKDVWVRRFAR